MKCMDERNAEQRVDGGGKNGGRSRSTGKGGNYLGVEQAKECHGDTTEEDARGGQRGLQEWRRNDRRSLKVNDVIQPLRRHMGEKKLMNETANKLSSSAIKLSSPMASSITIDRQLPPLHSIQKIL